MTDREAPAETPRPPTQPRTATAGDPSPHAHPEPARQGDNPPMPLTLAPRPPRTPGPDAPTDPVRGLFARVFAAPHDLPAFVPAALPAADRPPAEAAAAARAAGCPDLFVVHAPDPAAGERVIADIARASAGRVLILSPNPAAADRIAERLAKAGDAAVARALAEDENPARPSPAAARVTTAALGAGRVEQLKREAAATVAALDRLAGLAARVAELEAELAAVVAGGDGVERQVRDEVPTLPPAPVRAEVVSLVARQKALEDGIADLHRQHAEAAKKPGFFARLMGSKPRPTDAEVEKHLHDAERELAEVTATVAAAQAESEATAAAATAEREKRIADEVAARRAAFDRPAAGAAAELRRVRAEFEAVRTALPNVPADRDADLAAARERVAELARTGAELARRFLMETRVVVGIPAGLAADPVFDPDPAADPGPPFALLVLDRAEELTEPDFVRLARLGGRWVLVGDARHEEPRPHLNGAQGRHAPGRNGRPAGESFAARLARALDRETWAAEPDRLVCRLAHPVPEDRRHLTREPLLDRPEVELRFAHPVAEPVLAEVAFPAGVAVAAAKAFLFAQLGEVLLRPCGECRWHHAPNEIAVCWPAAEHGASPAEVAWVELEAGVREKVVGTGHAAFTAAVAFDPAAGWDAEAAAAWLAAHAAPHPGRFVAVPRPGATKG